MSDHVITPEEIADKIIKCVRNGGKILICGNGGSAAEAHHWVGEFLGKYKLEGEPIPAISLLDISTITSIANDYSYDFIFSRQISALGEAGDILITLSTSGRSKNIYAARAMAFVKKMIIIEMPTNNQLDTTTDQTQETHLHMIHQVMELVEKELR